MIETQGAKIRENFGKSKCPNQGFSCRHASLRCTLKLNDHNCLIDGTRFKLDFPQLKYEWETNRAYSFRL